MHPSAADVPTAYRYDRAKAHAKWAKLHGLFGLVWTLTLVGIPVAFVHYYWALKHTEHEKKWMATFNAAVLGGENERE